MSRTKDGPYETQEVPLEHVVARMASHLVWMEDRLTHLETENADLRSSQTEHREALSITAEAMGFLKDPDARCLPHPMNVARAVREHMRKDASRQGGEG